MEAVDQQHQPRRRGSKRYFLSLSLGALGVVFGDIGTSPLYAFRECFSREHGLSATPDNILGVLSLIFWALTFIISIAYLNFVMRADNRGEGGILALMSLIRPRSEKKSFRRGALIILGLFGASLLYGDGMITPAITVLSAMEGLQLASPMMEPWAIPMTIIVLIGLFIVQKFGTAKIGVMFGPIMVIWFVVIAVLGLMQVVKEPRVFAAIDPSYAIRFFDDNGLIGFLVLGAV